jgi:hypothetical protein
MAQQYAKLYETSVAAKSADPDAEIDELLTL